MKAIVSVVKGTADRSDFVLDAVQPTRLGRGNGCQVYLADPLSSRTHAIISFEDGKWTISDAESRNGTLLNEKRIVRAELTPGDRIGIGSTELVFQLPKKQEKKGSTSQTLVREASMSVEASGVSAVSQLGMQRRSQDMVDLYQLSLQLMRCSNPTEVARHGLGLLRQRTQATAVGLLWVNEQGELKPHTIVPDEMASKLQLSEDLTTRVSQQGAAIWVKTHLPTDRQEEAADAFCIPLMNDTEVIGAVHLYREKEKFNQTHFDFAISACTMLAVALERTRAQANLSAEHSRLVQAAGDFSELLGHSAEMESLKDRIARVAKVTGCALVRGESGVGKELVARAIHRISPRKNRPMLCVNCAAIPQELMESQLFGHKKGAFTGADKDHAGWFQQAHTGTLFLDEVGELSLDGQAKLLRILEGHPFIPVGGNKSVSVDVRVIAATNRDLREFVREKQFREDLYYRLSVFELFVPPLRDRGEDISLLIDHFLNHFRMQHGRQNIELSQEARQVLLDYAWPGNVRQLRNVLDSAVVLAAGSKIEPNDLSLRDMGVDNLDSLSIEVWEERLIREALKRTNNNVNEATKLLGLSRATLYRKLDQFGIKR